MRHLKLIPNPQSVASDCVLDEFARAEELFDVHLALCVVFLRGIKALHGVVQFVQVEVDHSGGTGKDNAVAVALVQTLPLDDLCL